MTMKYAHIGIENQAKALPLPAQSGSKRGVTNGQRVALDDSDEQDDEAGTNNKSPE